MNNGPCISGMIHSFKRFKLAITGGRLAVPIWQCVHCEKVVEAS